jgi:Flp pilus assembly protein TadD
MTAVPAIASLRSRLLSGAVAAPLALALLAGCANPKAATDPVTTGSIAQPLTQEDFDNAVAYWGERYKADEKAREPALNYAAALQRTGRNEQALAVLQRAVIHHPNDRDVLAAYGKSLAATGKFEMAIQTIRKAQTPDQPDWKLLSAEAAILDQIGRNDEARRLYARALDLSPNEPSVLSNFGMSYVLTGDLASAENLLRQAVAAPGADSRVRQNLALVVGLQGRFDEAERIAGEELAPEQAKANIAYLREMLAQRNTWQQLKGNASG